MNGRSFCRLGGHQWRALQTEKPFHVHDSMMLRVCHHSKRTPCRDSTWTISQYHCQGRCELNARSSCCLGGQMWRALWTKKPFHVHDSMMLRVCHHSKFTPCRDSTWATSQYHCQGRCGLNARSSCCLGGQLWRAVVGGLQLYSEGQGAKSCVVKCTRAPNQLSPHLPMDGVSTACSSTGP